MAIPNVVLNCKLDKATRLRLALTGGSAMDTEAREVTLDDVKSRWPMLGDSGCFADDVLNFANSKIEMDDEVFIRLMKSLNSYL